MPDSPEFLGDDAGIAIAPSGARETQPTETDRSRQPETLMSAAERRDRLLWLGREAINP